MTDKDKEQVKEILTALEGPLFYAARGRCRSIVYELRVKSRDENVQKILDSALAKIDALVIEDLNGGR